MLTRCGEVFRRSDSAYPIFILDLELVGILGLAKFEDNQNLTSHSIRFIIIHSFNPLWGEHEEVKEHEKVKSYFPSRNGY